MVRKTAFLFLVLSAFVSISQDVFAEEDTTPLIVLKPKVIGIKEGNAKFSMLVSELEISIEKKFKKKKNS